MKDAFCSREALLTIFHETKQFMLVYDKRPIVRGHMLIIPKRHVEDIIDLNKAEWEDLEQLKDKDLPLALSRYCKEARSYNMAIQIGEYSGREIDHLHMHIIPRTAEDTFKEDSGKLYSNIVDRQAGDKSGVEEEVTALRKLFKYKPERQ